MPHDGSIEIMCDVTEAADIGESAHVAATVFLPDGGAVAEPAVVCFAFPGGGYSRRYYSMRLSDDEPDGQAGWHTARGWVFVACDHLGVGDSTVPAVELTYETVARANHATVADVLARLAGGDVADGVSAIAEPVTLGIGQSMGGCFTIVAQGRHETFDGVGILGFSAIHTAVPSRPGGPTAPMPWIPRGTDPSNPVILNAAALATATGPVIEGDESMRAAAVSGEHPFAWAFHHDDEPADVVAADMAGMVGGELPPWRSATTPACAISMVTPGTVAAEAAAIRAPLFLGTGERDVVPDPKLEPKAYMSSPDVTVFVCERMAHMHNFAPTRQRFWSRLHAWGDGVATLAG